MLVRNVSHISPMVRSSLARNSTAKQEKPTFLRKLIIWIWARKRNKSWRLVSTRLGRPSARNVGKPSAGFMFMHTRKAKNTKKVNS